MNDELPGFGIDFQIDAGDSYAQLAQLDTMMKSTEAKILAQALSIEKATKGMIDVADSAANVRSLASTTAAALGEMKRSFGQVETAKEALDKALASTKVSTIGPADTVAQAKLKNEIAGTERAIDRLVAQIDRETAAVGRSREERQAARVEEMALTAAQQGNTDAADRLLTSVRALDAARRSAAEDAAAAATREAAAMAQEAQAVREAAFAHDLFQKKVREGAAAMAAADRESASFDAAVARVQARIDPAAAALARLRGELDEAKQAFDHGRITADGFAQEQARVAAAAGKLYGPQRDLTGATRELGVAQRFTANETLNLFRQLGDVGTTAAMGMNPFMILIQQGPQVVDVLQQVEMRGVKAGAALTQMGKDAVTWAGTGLARLAPLINPVNLLLAGTAVAVIAVVHAVGSYGEALSRFEKTAAGLGRVSGQSATQLERIAEAAAAAGDRSIGATRDSVAAFAAAGIEGERTLTSLASVVDKYAKLTGQDVTAAQAALAEAMKDPAKAADTFTESLGLLTGAQYEHIRQLAAQGDQEQATAELTRILTADIEANSNQATGLAHVMDLLGSAVAGVSTMFGKLDQRIRTAGASYDEWLKRNVGGWAVDLIGTGNKAPIASNANAGRNQDQVAALNASQTLNTSGLKQYNDLLAQQRLLQRGLADTTGLTGAQVQALRHDYAAVTDTINANRNASGAWITTQERAHLVAVAQDKLASARTQKEKAAAQQQITRLQLGTQVLTQQERMTQAQDAYNKVADRYQKPKNDHHADDLARQAKAIEAQIDNTYKFVGAYQVSGAAALLAEARVKAETDAIKKRGDVEAFVDRQVRLVIADRVRGAAQNAAAMRDEAAQQELVNAQVAAGNLSASDAAEILRGRMADLPLLTALEAARTLKGKEGTIAVEAATKALEDQRAATDRLTDARRKAQLLDALAGAQDQLAYMREELRLIGSTEVARARALAVFKAEQEAKAKNWAGPDAAAWVKTQGDIAAQGVLNSQAVQAYNDQLSATADRWDAIARNVATAGRGMAEAFGAAGQAVGDLASIYTAFNANRTAAELKRDEAIRRGTFNERQQAQFALANSTARIGMYGDMAAAARGFFQEDSDGYKAATKAMQIFRAVEFALSVRAMAQDAIETGSKIASSVARTAAHATEAVVKAISSLPFPLNIAAGAATIAALAGIGVSVIGGLGGGSKNTLAPANTGTGTVLGDSEAKSASIKNAIDALKEVDTLTNSYARQMAASLKTIESQIGSVASLVVRSGVNDSSSTVAEGFRPNAIGSVLGKIPLIGGFLSSLFGSKTTVLGNGLYGGAQSLGSILSGGFNAQAYTDIEKTSKFLGITTSKKTSTHYSAVDPSLGNQFTLLLRSFSDAIGAAAVPLGQSTQAIQDRLNGFVVSIGKIDLKGLTGEQIEEKLTAVFGAAADGMAAAAFPGIERFQKVGEGAFETLVRVSSTVEAVTTALDQLSTSTKALGIDAKLGLAGQFDSISSLTSAVDGYFAAFYTKEEQAAAKGAQLAAVFGSLGLTMPASLAAFRQLVEAQDLTTAAGQATYATLLKLAPAFADVKAAMEGAKSAADILSERDGLQRQLLELQGDTAAIRALDSAKLDASNRALQQQVWSIQDAQAAAKAAEELRQAWTSVGDSIMDEVKRIRGLTDVAGGNSFAVLQGQFNAATAAARAGDQDAAKNLPQLSQALLTAAADQATSRQELARVQAMTAASLEATYGVVTALAKGTAAPATTTQIVDAAAAAQGGTAKAAANDDLASEIKSLREEVAGMRSENNSAQAAIAGNTRRIASKLDDVTADSGGTAISVASAA